MRTRTANVLRRSGLPVPPYGADSLALRASDPGQVYPQHCPQPQDAVADLLGEPLSIRAAAKLIGCSAWTVRQKYLPAGLPCHRLSPAGKLIFYRNQIIRWLICQQQKGGITL